MLNLSTIKAHFEVIGSDGEPMGRKGEPVRELTKAPLSSAGPLPMLGP